MNRRVFLDVGANVGQTLAAALDPIFRFDRIVCFEPVPSCWPRLTKLADDRVTIEHFGLWSQTCRAPIFDPDGKGGSVYHKDNAKTKASVQCRFRRASDWFAEHIDPTDTVWLKLNCEGAECDILDDLLDSGEFAKVAFLMVDFDVRKIAAQKHREAETRIRLEPYPFPRMATTKQVMVGLTHADRIKHWLRLTEAAE